MPDAFIFALLATVIVVVAALTWTPSSPLQVVDAWGSGFWDLIPFTLQMALVIITGHVLATSAPMGASIRAIAGVAAHAARRRGAGDVLRDGQLVVQLGLLPDLQRGAGARGGAARRGRRLPRARRRELPRPRQHLGAGAQRIGGAADGHARRAAAADPRHRRRTAGIVPGGIIPFRDTIFLWQSLVSVVDRDRRRDAGDVAGDAAGRRRRKTARDLGIDLGDERDCASRRRHRADPAGRVARALAAAHLALRRARRRRTSSATSCARREPLNAITLNIVNLAFLLLGVAAAPHAGAADARGAGGDAGGVGRDPAVPVLRGHRRRSSRRRISTSGSRMRSSASRRRQAFPALVAIYSAVLGVFVPSGGSKWVIEAPYVMAAAHELKVHLGWVVASYDLGEALANLVQPFWMLPILGDVRACARAT